MPALKSALSPCTLLMNSFNDKSYYPRFCVPRMLLTSTWTAQSARWRWTTTWTPNTTAQFPSAPPRRISKWCSTPAVPIYGCLLPPALHCPVLCIAHTTTRSQALIRQTAPLSTYNTGQGPWTGLFLKMLWISGEPMCRMFNLVRSRLREVTPSCSPSLMGSWEWAGKKYPSTT